MQNDMLLSDYLAFNIEIFIKLFEDGTFCDAETLRKQVEITFLDYPNTDNEIKDVYYDAIKHLMEFYKNEYKLFSLVKDLKA